MPIAIQVTPVSAAGVQVALNHQLQPLKQRAWEATRTTAGQASRFPAGAPGRRPCSVTITVMKVSVGCSPTASLPPGALLYLPDITIAAVRASLVEL